MISDVQVAIDDQNPNERTNRISSSETNSENLILMDMEDDTESNQIVFKTSSTSNGKPTRSIDQVNKEHFSKYQTIESIYKYLETLNATYPTMVNLFEIGKTYEGREQKAIHIHAPHTLKGNRRNHDKQELVFHGGHHARVGICLDHTKEKTKP
jgi:uncharacterized protein YrzB (UPF0473 family)